MGRAALEEVLGTAEAKARNGGAGALEEDARLTALFLWTLQATTQEAEPVSTTNGEDVDAVRLAHRAVGDKDFVRGTGKTLQARGRFEGAQGSERRQFLGHVVC